MDLERKIRRTSVAHGAILLLTSTAIVLLLGNLVSGCAPTATPVPVETPTPYLSPVPAIVPRPGYLVGRPTSPWGPVPDYKVIFYGPIESDEPLDITFEASDYKTFAFPIPDDGTYIVTFADPETRLKICEYELVLDPQVPAVIGCDSGMWEAPLWPY